MIGDIEKDRNGNTCWSCSGFQYNIAIKKCVCELDDCYDLYKNVFEKYQKEDFAISREKLLCMCLEMTKGLLKLKINNVLESQIESAQKLTASKLMVIDIVNNICEETKDILIQKLESTIC